MRGTWLHRTEKGTSKELLAPERSKKQKMANKPRHCQVQTASLWSRETSPQTSPNVQDLVQVPVAPQICDNLLLPKPRGFCL